MSTGRKTFEKKTIFFIEDKRHKKKVFLTLFPKDKKKLLPTPPPPPPPIQVEPAEVQVKWGSIFSGGEVEVKKGSIFFVGVNVKCIGDARGQGDGFDKVDSCNRSNSLSTSLGFNGYKFHSPVHSYSDPTENTFSMSYI